MPLDQIVSVKRHRGRTVTYFIVYTTESKFQFNENFENYSVLLSELENAAEQNRLGPSDMQLADKFAIRIAIVLGALIIVVAGICFIVWYP